MRGVFGPILTTAVVVTAAAVVAANPVMGSRADIQIRPVDLSSGSADMLDPDFLKAIAPSSSGTGGPLGVLKDLVNALVADAAYIGRNGVQALGSGAGAADTADLASPSDLFGLWPATPAAPVSPQQAPADPGQVAAQALASIAGETRNTDVPAVAGPPVSPEVTQAAVRNAYELVSVELPHTLDSVAAMVASVPLAPPVIANTISALGQQLASLPAARTALDSSSAGDTPDTATAPAVTGRQGQASGGPTASPPASPDSGGAGTTGSSGGVTKSVGGGKLFPLHRPWRPGKPKQGPNVDGNAGGTGGGTVAPTTKRILGR